MMRELGSAKRMPRKGVPLNILCYHPASVRRVICAAMEEKISGLDLPGAGNGVQQGRLSDSIGPDEPDHAAGRKTGF
jgi:hypothetical protein